MAETGPRSLRCAPGSRLPGGWCSNGEGGTLGNQARRAASWESDSRRALPRPPVDGEPPTLRPGTPSFQGKAGHPTFLCGSSGRRPSGRRGFDRRLSSADPGPLELGSFGALLYGPTAVCRAKTIYLNRGRYLDASFTPDPNPRKSFGDSAFSQASVLTPPPHGRSALCPAKAPIGITTSKPAQRTSSVAPIKQTSRPTFLIPANVFGKDGCSRGGKSITLRKKTTSQHKPTNVADRASRGVSKTFFFSAKTVRSGHHPKMKGPSFKTSRCFTVVGRRRPCSSFPYSPERDRALTGKTVLTWTGFDLFRLPGETR